MSAEIGAVDFDRAGELGFVGVVNLRAHRIAQLVGENERRLVLNVEIPAQRESTYALDVVTEDRDGREVVADRQLAGKFVRVQSDPAERDHKTRRHPSNL